MFRTDDVSSPLIQDVLFGPIMPLESFDDERVAIERANATRHGLAASVRTHDLNRLMAGIEKAASESCMVSKRQAIFLKPNTYSTMPSCNGAGSVSFPCFISILRSAISRLGNSRAPLITDRGVVSADMLDLVLEAALAFVPELYGGTTENSFLECLETWQERSCDGLIALRRRVSDRPVKDGCVDSEPRRKIGRLHCQDRRFRPDWQGCPAYLGANHRRDRRRDRSRLRPDPARRHKKRCGELEHGCGHGGLRPGIDVQPSIVLDDGTGRRNVSATAPWRLDLHHGTPVGILLPPVLRFNRHVAREKLGNL